MTFFFCELHTYYVKCRFAKRILKSRGTKIHEIESFLMEPSYFHAPAYY